MDIRLNIAAPRPRTYAVRGTTIDALRSALTVHGEWGTYSGALNINVRGDPVTRVTVTARPVITMPEWREYDSASPEMQGEWDRMIVALARHEQGHDDILRREAAAFRDEVNALSPPPDRRATRRMASDLLRRHATAQNGYDRTTNHGQRDGVDLHNV